MISSFLPWPSSFHILFCLVIFLQHCKSFPNIISSYQKQQFSHLSTIYILELSIYLQVRRGNKETTELIDHYLYCSNWWPLLYLLRWIHLKYRNDNQSFLLNIEICTPPFLSTILPLKVSVQHYHLFLFISDMKIMRQICLLPVYIIRYEVDPYCPTPVVAKMVKTYQLDELNKFLYLWRLFVHRYVHKKLATS